MIITAIFLLVEVGGGKISGSLALVSDVCQIFSDPLSLISLPVYDSGNPDCTKERIYGSIVPGYLLPESFEL